MTNSASKGVFICKVLVVRAAGRNSQLALWNWFNLAFIRNEQRQESCTKCTTSQYWNLTVIFLSSSHKVLVRRLYGKVTVRNSEGIAEGQTIPVTPWKGNIKQLSGTDGVQLCSGYGDSFSTWIEKLLFKRFYRRENRTDLGMALIE